METIVFIGTVIMCTCIIVISETLDRISSIEKYDKFNNLALDFIQKEERKAGLH